MILKSEISHCIFATPARALLAISAGLLLNPVNAAEAAKFQNCSSTGKESAAANAPTAAAKVTHEFALYPSGGHGYGLRCTKEAKAWPDRCAVWLKSIKVLP